MTSKLLNRQSFVFSATCNTLLMAVMISSTIMKYFSVQNLHMLHYQWFYILFWVGQQYWKLKRHMKGYIPWEVELSAGSTNNYHFDIKDRFPLYCTCFSNLKSCLVVIKFLWIQLLFAWRQKNISFQMIFWMKHYWNGLQNLTADFISFSFSSLFPHN